MKSLILFIIFFLYFGQCAEDPTPTTLDDTSEDTRVLEDTIAKYGPPQDYKQLGFPGPEIALDEEKYLHKNHLKLKGSGNYTLRTRTITPYWSYNRHYEEVKIPQSFYQPPDIKSQFSKHFGRKSGGFYIRTIGYKIDENGYQPFLLDLTIAETSLKKTFRPSLTFCSGGNYGLGSTFLGPSGTANASSTILTPLTKT
ncbi:uncharacterized protein LOC123013579 [Tribolium madens]|uniref:uncharacterized protein LOC123013579 n=1 Tax=Tribolium madens TaxID=41895 RepID=UPI001CF75D5D|nr:uncharacterized protein LOC123013579 [Tribolium madens]